MQGTDENDIILTDAKRRLASRCRDVIDLINEVMRLGADSAHHHALTVLIGECRWCIAEVCKEDDQCKKKGET